MSSVSDITVKLIVDSGDVTTALNSVSSAVNKSSGGMNVALMQAGQAIGNVGKDMVGFGKDSFNTYAGFERGMSRVSAMSGTFGSDLEAIRAKAKELGKTTEFTATDATKAFEAMALAGWSNKDMLAGVDGALNLATISGLDFGQVTSYLINTMAPFGKTASDSTAIVDLMAKTATSANFNVNDLAKSFEYVAPIAGAMGYSMNDCSTALALLANNGLKGSKAGTSLRTILTNLNSQAKNGAIDINGYAVAIQNSDGSMRPLKDVLMDMAGRFSGMSQSQKEATAQTIAGKTGMAGLLALMNGGAGTIQTMSDKVNDYTGASTKMSDTIRNDAMGSIEKFNSAWDGVKIAIGGVIAEALLPVMNAISNLINWFSSLDPATQKVVTTIGTVIAVTATLVGGLTAVGGIVSVLTGGLEALGLSFSGVLIPIGLVVGAVVGIGAELMNLWNTNENFRNAVTSAWNFVQSAFTVVWTYITNFIQNVIPPIWNDLAPMIQTVWNGIVTYLSTWWDGFKTVFSTVVEAIKAIWTVMAPVVQAVWAQLVEVLKAGWQVFKGVFTVVVEAIKIAWKVMTTIITAVWDSTVGIIKAVWSVFAPAFQEVTSIVIAVWNAVGGAIGKVWDGVVSGVKWAWEGIKAPFKAVCDWIGGIWQGIKNFFKLPHLTVSGTMNPLDWGSQGLPKFGVEWYAKGGIFNGSQVIGVGENGTEAVIPLSNSQKVKPFAEAVASQLDTDGNSGALTVNVAELVVREEADIRRIAQELYKLQQFKARSKGRYS